MVDKNYSLKFSTKEEFLKYKHERAQAKLTFKRLIGLENTIWVQFPKSRKISYWMDTRTCQSLKRKWEKSTTHLKSDPIAWLQHCTENNLKIDYTFEDVVYNNIHKKIVR